MQNNKSNEKNPNPRKKVSKLLLQNFFSQSGGAIHNFFNNK